MKSVSVRRQCAQSAERRAPRDHRPRRVALQGGAHARERPGAPTEETKFIRDGQPVERDEVKPGAEVRAAYEPRGDLAYAKEVEVLSGGQEK